MAEENAAPRPPVLRFSTADLPARDRFEACRARVAAWKDLLAADGAAANDFRLDTATWRFGALALSRTDGADPAVNRRSAAHVRRDMLDHWTVSVLLRGTIRGECGGVAFAAEPGIPFVCGLHYPQETERGAADWLTLFVPRDAEPSLSAILDAGPPVRPLTGGLGTLLGMHLTALPATLDNLAQEDAPRAAEATLALLKAAAAGPPVTPAATPPVEGLLRAQLLALIRREIGSVRLDPVRLARLAGLSRTRLYEIFKAEGGVARAIQRERLRAIRRTMADPAEHRPISAIAAAYGFVDASVFARAFRCEFGLTAGEFREQARQGRVTPAGQDAGTDDLYGVLRGLRA